MEFFQGLDWGAYYHFQFMRQFMRSTALDPIMRIGHWLGSIWFFFVLAALGLVLHASRGGKNAVWRLSAVMIVGCAAVEVVRRMTPRPRPVEAIEFVTEAEMALSFPSRSVLLATLGLFVVATALEHRCKSWKQLLSLTVVVSAMIAWVAYSQLYLSVHYVTDVISGLLAGLAMGLMGRHVIGDSQSGG